MRQRSHWIPFFLLVLMLGVIDPDAAAITFQELKEHEKIALSLTGRPLSAEHRAGLVSGQLTRRDLIEQLTKSPAFVDHLARFWVDKIGIVNRLSVTEMLLKGRRDRFLNTLEGSQENFGFNPKNVRDNRDNAGLDDVIQRLNRKNSKRLEVKTCGDKRVIYHDALAGDRIPTIKKIIETGKWPDTPEGSALKGDVEKYRSILKISEEYGPACDSPELQAIQPFWEPTGENWQVAKRLVDPGVCGADLSKCWIRPNFNDYQTHVDEYFTMEPGYLIAHIVAEDQPFTQVLTSTRTVANEMAAYFFKTHMPMNNAIDNFPGGAYQEKDEARWKSPRVNRDKKRFWVERTPLHAGVLTTFAFHMTTNGRRAKANRLFEVFMCSRFTVPQGAMADPFDDNPDLRKRTYCSNCHRTLEPMAEFFNRWPDTGRVTMEYNSDTRIDESGMFLGESGKGVVDFAKIASESEAFHSCSIRRAFEFLHGRELTQAEASVLVPRYKEVYEGSGFGIRALLKAMIDAPEFSQAQGGN